MRYVMSTMLAPGMNNFLSLSLILFITANLEQLAAPKELSSRACTGVLYW
jgi:hypothetical protein